MASILDLASGSVPTTRNRIEDIARQSNVPVNVLMALGEVAGVRDDVEAIQFAERAAQDLGSRLQAGRGMEDIIREVAGDRADDFIARSRQIADELYPEQAARARAAREAAEAQRQAEQPGIIGDAGRLISASAIGGAGAAIEGAGTIIDQPLSLFRDEENYAPGMIARGARIAGDWLREVGSGLRAGVSDATRQAIANSTPEGDITDLSSISLGADPSLRGYAMLGADVFGSFLPVVLAAVAGGPGLAAAVGGAQGAGAGGETGREIIAEAFAQRGEDGRTALEVNSPMFQELRAQGMSEEQAFTVVSDAASRLASIFGGSVAAAGGAATGALIRGVTPAGIGATGGPLRRALTVGALSATEEGLQEAAESIAARYGVQASTGMPVNLTEDSFANFLLGALGGGPIGAASGAAQGFAAGREDDEQRNGQGLVSPQPAAPGGVGQQGAGPTSAQPNPVAAATSAEPATGRDESTQPIGLATMRLRGEAVATEVEVLGETEDTITVRDASGQTLVIPRADIASGDVEFTPISQMIAPGMAVGQPVQSQPVDAGEPMTVDQARARYNEISARARESGWDEDLVNEQSQLRAFLRRMGAEPLSAQTQPEANEWQVVTRPDGRPFPNERVARQALGRLGLSQAGYTITPRDGGFVALPPPAAAQEVPDAGVRDEPLGSSGTTGAIPMDDGGRSRIPRLGFDPGVGDGATNPPIEPTGAAGVGGVVDATSPGQPTAALNEQQDVQLGGNATYQGRQVQITREGPWDFSSSFPEPDPARLRGRLEQGRDDGIDSAEAVAATLDETMRDMVERAARGVSWADDFARIARGEAPRNAIPKGKDPATYAQEQAGLAARDADDMAASLSDLWSDDAVQAFQDEALRRARDMLRQDIDDSEPAPLSQQPGLASAVAPQTGPVIENIRQRAAVLRGIPKDKPPVVEGVSLKWDEREGGFIFSRKHVDRVRAALGISDNQTTNPAIGQPTIEQTAQPVADRPPPAGVDAQPETGAPPAPEQVTQPDTFKPGERVSVFYKDGPRKGWNRGKVVRENTQDGERFVSVLLDDGTQTTGVRPTPDRIVRGDPPKEPPADSAPPAAGASAAETNAPETPDASPVAAAAQETDPNPTPAQAEAENYRTGKAEWKGLTLSVENAKGSTRRGVGKDGKEWSVTMPAHYGRILRTTGADGDHVDFYMGDNEQSESVWVFDQLDAETGRFDEHKVMLGFNTPLEAAGTYADAFNDNRGAERLGGYRKMSIEGFKEWLASGDTKKPVSRAVIISEAEATKANGDTPEATPPAPPAATADQTQAADQQALSDKTKKRAERDVFIWATTNKEALEIAGTKDLAGFIKSIDKLLVEQIQAIAAEYEPERRDAILAMVADGRPVLPRDFYINAHKDARKAWEVAEKERARDGQAKTDAIEAAMGAAGVAGEAEIAQFTAGFEHALTGKSRSTLPQDGRYGDGYEAARAWIKTDAGKVWFDGRKRGPKEKSTGEVLRRHWELAKKGIDAASTDDMKKAWAAILKATQRADFFPDMLAEDATPGAREWLSVFRDRIATFQEYFSWVAAKSEHNPRSRFGGKAEDYFTGRHQTLEGRIAERGGTIQDGKYRRTQGVTDAVRLEITKEIAAEYQQQVSDLAKEFDGAKSLADIKAIIERLYGKPGDYKLGSMEAGDVALYHGKYSGLVSIFPQRPEAWDYKYSPWAHLIANEANDIFNKDTNRKPPLIRPRLDKIERNTRDVRNGKAVSAEQVKTTFGFADVTIGEYVTSQEAEDHLNYAHDAFITLSDLLGIDPSQVGFGGRLHLSIGALGHGKHAAHFSPNHPLDGGGTVAVINLTKTKGDGTVLHEYFHAIDLMTKDRALKAAIAGIKKNLVERLRSPDEVISIAEGFLSGQRSMTRMGRGATVRDHAIAGLRYYRNRWGARTKFFADAVVLDGGQRDAEVSDPYWSNDVEPFARAAEAWAFDTLKEAGQRDDYLVSDWVEDGKVTEKTYRGTPYPMGAERERFRSLFTMFARSMDWSDGLPKLKDGHEWHKTPPFDVAPWLAAIEDAKENLDAIETAMLAKHAEKKRLREEQAEKDRLEALFGPGATQTPETPEAVEAQESDARDEEAAAIEAETAVQNDTAMSYDEMSALWDDIAAQDAEASQETPDVAQPDPAPPAKGPKAGDPAPPPAKEPMRFTREDAAFLLKAIDEGSIVLVADKSLGIPTIHDIKGAEHLGFGVFRVITPEYSGGFDAGSSMRSLPSGQPFTFFTPSNGTPPWWNRADVIATLEAFGRPKAQGGAPSLDSEVKKTAGQLASEFAQHGVAGIEETMTALVKLFGGANTLRSFPGGFDENTYRAAKPHFIAAAARFREAGHSFREFVRLFFDAMRKQFGDGMKEYAIRFAMDYQAEYEAKGAQPETQAEDAGPQEGVTPAAPPAPAGPAPAAKPESAERTPEARVSDWVLSRLRRKEKIDWRELFTEADKAWGGTQANGVYGPKDAYDAVELGINRHIIESGLFEPSTDSTTRARADMGFLEAILDLVPTQSKRTPEMDEFQQFSTPPHFAYLANWVANLRTSDDYLEPSAGIGGLAMFGHIAKVNQVVVNELSGRRLAVLRNLPFQRFFSENAEQIANILPKDIRPSVVVMNPPFSATAGRKEGTRDTKVGAKHIEQALKLLRPGGRLVAIVGQGMAHDAPTFKAWWRKIGAEYAVRANVGLDGSSYAKYGTTFDTQILVIDKVAPDGQNVVTAEKLHPRDALAILKGVRDVRPDAVANDQDVAPGSGGVSTAQGGGASPIGTPPLTDRPSPVGGGSARPGGRGGKGNGGPGGSGGSAQPGAGVSDGNGSGRPGNGGSAGNAGGRNPDADRGGDGGDASGRPGPDASGGDAALGLSVGTAEGADKGEIGESVFESYRPKKVRIEGAVPHNTKLVESSAMAAVLPPDPTYSPNLPASVVRKGLLSDAQLESVVYAGQAHQQMIGDGETRRGFFLGDGTGVGKGRQISGVILDNMRQGRKKAVWISFKNELIEDAKRDFSDLGGDKDQIFRLDKHKVDKPLEQKEGILFAAYSTLRSQAKGAGKDKKKSGETSDWIRVQQIVDWLGEDFDGALIFDEAHKMGNAVATKGSRGKKQASSQALAGIALQRALPKARVMYVSATGATEVSNLAYAERLGLWGKGTPFADRLGFINEMSQSVSAMELVAQNLKQMGLYLARSLSFDDVRYERLEHSLSEYQRETYDVLATAWQTVLQNIDRALEAIGASNEEGKPVGSDGRKIKANLMSQFWGAHQRFFNQIITASQMPSVLEQMDQDIAADRSVVLQITSTNEADQERALDKQADRGKGKDQDDDDQLAEDLDLTPREMLVGFLERSFPTQQFEEAYDADGNEILIPVTSADGTPVENADAVAMRESLIAQIRAMRIPDSALQMLLDRYGPDAVAEITGRSRRVIVLPDGKFKVEPRSPAAVAADAQAFKDGKKRILIFSQAGGTGFSFQSDLRYKNQQQRAHYILQAGWSADAAVQGFGRTHRTNQRNAPIYRLVTTDLPAQKRFVSSIARRLEQLGALTAGQRDTAGGSIFSAADNLESTYAAAATRSFFEQMAGAARPASIPTDILAQMGLDDIVDPKTGQIIETKMPPTTKFLNRLLSLTTDVQPPVFEHFMSLLEDQIETAKRLGRFDDGLKTIRHVGASVVHEKEVYKDERSGAGVNYAHIQYKTPNEIYDFDVAARAIERAEGPAGFFRNKISGKVAGVITANRTRTTDDGRIVKQYRVFRTSGPSLVDHGDMSPEKWERLDDFDVARTLWEAENAERPLTRTTNLHMVVGGILPIWDRFSTKQVDVVRIRLDDGRRLLGRMIPEAALEETLRNMNVENPAARMSAKDLMAALMGGQTVTLSNGWTLEKRRVSNDNRIELMAPPRAYVDPSRRKQMVDAGLIVERIQWNDRMFVPIGKPAVLEQILRTLNANATKVSSEVAEMRGEASPAAAPAGWGQVDADPEITDADLAAIGRAVTLELRKHGLDEKVTAKVARGIYRPAMGVYRRTVGEITVTPQDANGPGTIGVLRHEIIHALRDSTLWLKEHGLFTRDEWQGLVRAARTDKKLMARIDELYPDLGTSARFEEAVAEMYRMWAQNRDQRSGIDRAFRKMRAFFMAMANALRGRGFQSAALTFEKIAGGTVGGRGPGGGAARDAAREKFGDPPAGPVSEMRGPARAPNGTFASRAAEYSRQLLGGGAITDASERSIVGQILTDAMGGKSSRYNTMALIPGEPLYQELAKNLLSAKAYLKFKHAMGAMRNTRQVHAAETIDRWRAFLSKDRKGNEATMELMHEATIVGLDPAKPFTVRKRRAKEPQAEYDAFVEGRRREYMALKEKWDALPAAGRAIYVEVRDAYTETSETERQILLDNVAAAMEINLKRARQRLTDDLRKIEEDGLTGAERQAAEDAANARYAAVKKRDGYGRNARLATLRLKLEQGQVEGPYFPLMRHGNYYLTVKDRAGKVVSFSKFESERAQMQEAARQRRAYPDFEIKTGVMTDNDSAPDIDPGFVAEVEEMIGATIDDPKLMDAIWQRYIESLPDFSIRKSHLHRQGTPGFARDAFRNFARQQFHSAHQLARLKYGMQMQLAVEDMQREADQAEDPNRAMAVANEIARRHEWVMNPQSSAWSTWATSAAFVYYLGLTPAAAIVNISQTVVVGIPVLAAGFKKGSIGGASRHLMRALRQFGQGRGEVAKSKALTDDERKAIHDAYDRGVIDKSQAHDLAGIAESGQEYSDIRARMMRPIAFLFHHTERLNREITFIAAYRMAREDGIAHEQAIDKASELTWKTHFNYDADSRPRVMHNDFLRVALVFRNYSVNLLFRLFRDLHQTINGRSEAERKEARTQLLGITGMMMVSAGITGTWGYALLTTLAGLFLPGDADDIEEEIKAALVNTFGRDVAGLILNGVPTQLTGIDLSARIGMPELWFRRPDRQLEGDDLYTYWAEQFLGAVPGMIQNGFRGVGLAMQGEVWRGVETAMPKAVRDLMRGYRYTQDGVTTIRGEPILDGVTPMEAIVQALGFTPARISERYETNQWMKNDERQITDQRSRLLRRATSDIRDRQSVGADTTAAIRAFNAENPDYVIDSAAIRRSLQARQRAGEQMEGGIRINPRLDARIRADAAPTIYDDEQ